jgi:cytochrome P450
MNKALQHELLLYWLNRPLIMLLGEITSRLGKCIYVPGMGYMINDPVLGGELLNHPTFTSSGKGGMGGMITPVVGKYALLNMDGNAHRELKQKLVGLFSRKYIDTVLEEALGDLLPEMQHELEAGREIDLVYYVHQLTNRVTCHMLGISLEGQARESVFSEISELATKLTAFMKFEKLEPTPSDLEKVLVYYERLLSFADNTYGQTAAPNNSLTHRLREMGMTLEETRGLVAVILLAGTETVSAALPRIVALLLDSGQFRALAADRSILGSAIDEGLRVVCASPAILRGVEQDTEVKGFRFKQERRVVVLLYNMLKHSAYFYKPRHFNITREIDPNFKHLWFGAGPHFCLGFSLAQREIGLVLETLLNLPGELKIVRRKYPRGKSFPSYDSLILRLER